MSVNQRRMALLKLMRTWFAAETTVATNFIRRKKTVTMLVSITPVHQYFTTQWNAGNLRAYSVWNMFCWSISPTQGLVAKIRKRLTISSPSNKYWVALSDDTAQCQRRYPSPRLQTLPLTYSPELPPPPQPLNWNPSKLTTLKILPPRRPPLPPPKAWWGSPPARVTEPPNANGRAVRSSSTWLPTRLKPVCVGITRGSRSSTMPWSSGRVVRRRSALILMSSSRCLAVPKGCMMMAKLISKISPLFTNR